MSDVREPMVRKVETTDAEVSYKAWLRTKVAENFADSRPKIPHDEVERRMAERVAALKVRAPLPAHRRSVSTWAHGGAEFSPKLLQP